MSQATERVRTDAGGDPGAGGTASRDLFAPLLRVGRALKRSTPGGPVDGPTLGVLMEIAAMAPVRLSELAPVVGLDASTVSRHVSGLERAGYVAREPDPDDRRASRLAATDAGRDVLAAALTARRDVLTAALGDWPDTDLAALAGLLDRLADDLDRTRRRPSPARQTAVELPR